MKGGEMSRGYGMGKSKPGAAKRNPKSKGALPGIAKGGGMSGSGMKGGGGMPNLPKSNKPKAR